MPEATVEKLFTNIASRVAGAAGKPLTFILALSIIGAWGLSGPIFQWSDTWQLVVNTATTIVTFLMVFLIQNSQNRDASSMQAKLDELLRAVEKAREGFIGIEQLSDREIEIVRAALEDECGENEQTRGRPHESVERLLRRR
jgi:low affinity Fe/Cu permease